MQCILCMVAVLLTSTTKMHAQNEEVYKIEFNEDWPVFFPLAEKDFIKLSSGFGYRMHPVLHKIKKHYGVDLVAEKGKPVFAAANGVVSKSDFHTKYGRRIVLSHSGEIKTLYGHLMYQFVKPGSMVKQGQIIGLVGDTGMATGAHLHYEMWIKKKKINPVVLWNVFLKNAKNQIAKN